MISLPGYRLLGRVASGASGTVFRAEQTDLARLVAIKLLRPGLFGEEETRARFEREARLQASRSHPNLVAVYDAGFADGQPYLVTEFVEGGSLRDRLQRPPPLALTEAARLAAEMAEGLACAHEAGIVHRDLKPENVLLTSDGVAKLADFGLARGAPGSHTLQTAAGVVLGTPGYLAPELLEASQPTAATDLYALGVILFEMLAGRRPHERVEPMEELRACAQQDAPSLGEFLPGVPASLEELIRDCLSRSPSGRPAGAAVVATRLALLAASMAAAPSTTGKTIRFAAAMRPEAGSRTERETRLSPGAQRPGIAARPRHRWRRTAAAATLLAALAGLLAYHGGAPGHEDAQAPARPAAGAPQQPVRLAVPEVAAGADRVSLRLARAPSRPLTLTWWKKATPRYRSSKQFQPGTGPIELDGLEAGARYAAELRAEGRAPAATCAFEFSTLVRAGSPPVLTLTPERTNPQYPLVATAGNVVLAAWWHCGADMEHCSLVSRASVDGGTTWSEPERFATTSTQLSPLALAAAGEGFQLAWVDFATPQMAGVFTSFHGKDRSGWSVPAFVPPGRRLDRRSLLFPHGVALLRGREPSELDLVSCMGEANWPSHRLGHTRFAAGHGPVPPLVPVAKIAQDDMAARLVRVGKRLHILERFRPEGNAADTLRWTWVDDDGSTRPDGFGQVTDPSENVDSAPSVTALDGRVALVYQANGFLYCRTLAPGDLRFSKATRVTRATAGSLFFREGYPSLVTARRRYLLAHVDGHSIKHEWRLYLTESADGVTWTRRGTRELPRELITDVSAAVTSDAVVAVARHHGSGVLFTRFPLDWP